jgi:hypothetical protein
VSKGRRPQGPDVLRSHQPDQAPASPPASGPPN